MVSINGSPCADLTYPEVIKLMESVTDSLRMLVKRYGAPGDARALGPHAGGDGLGVTLRTGRLRGAGSVCLNRKATVFAEGRLQPTELSGRLSFLLKICVSRTLQKILVWFHS